MEANGPRCYAIYHRSADYAWVYYNKFNNDPFAPPLSGDNQEPSYRSGHCVLHYFEANDNDLAYYNQADN